MPSRVEIPKFPNNKRIAVTTSFDDGVIHDRRVIEAFNEWGLKGTWNLNSGRFKPHEHSANFIPPNEVATLYAGHEVAIHTVTHPHLPKLDHNQIATEVLDDRKALEDLVQYPVRGMAYPYGTFDKHVIEVLRALGIAYARTTQKMDACFPPEERLAWAATNHQYDKIGDIGVPEKWNDWYHSKWFNGVFFIWGHTYEFNNKNDWQSLERIYKPLAGKLDVWYCTNIQLFDYEHARRQIQIAANKKSAHNPTALPITLLVDGRSIEVPPGATILLEN
jgi:peptidoglycan/xylan/chitin deacetylase (PgdA/CDA1 family)